MRSSCFGGIAVTCLNLTLSIELRSCTFILSLCTVVDMKEFSVSDARKDLPSLVDRCKKEPIVINRHGKPEAVIIGIEQYEEFLDAVEELEDIAMAEESLLDPGPNIPWEKVKKDLGL